MTTRALVATDAGKYLYSTGADAVALTIPADIFTADDEINLFQAGAGQLSIVAGDGVSIISKGSNLKLSETGSGAVLKYISANTWHLVGDLTA